MISVSIERIQALMKGNINTTFEKKFLIEGTGIRYMIQSFLNPRCLFVSTNLYVR